MDWTSHFSRGDGRGGREAAKASLFLSLSSLCGSFGRRAGGTTREAGKQDDKSRIWDLVSRALLLLPPSVSVNVRMRVREKEKLFFFIPEGERGWRIGDCLLACLLGDIQLSSVRAAGWQDAWSPGSD